jgi:DNA-binding transcriptional MerR regulator
MSLQENLLINKSDFSEADQFFKTIGEVSAELGIPPHVLRFWESKFFRIKPHKRKGGHRYYNKMDVEVIHLIKKLLYDEGYTIKGAQKYLREHGVMQQNQAVEGQQSLFSQGKEVLPTENNKADLAPQDLFSIAAQSPEKIDPRAVKLLLKELESIKQALNKK